MNNQEAKFILSAYRAGGEDARDPKMTEALDQVMRDPELAEWFANERAFDAAMSDALFAAPIPTDLRQTILAGGKIARHRPSRWRTPILAVAAALLVAAVIAGILMRPSSELDKWQKDALATIPSILAGQMRFDHESNDARVLQQWLQAQRAPAPNAMPASLQLLPALGCKVMSSDGRRVSIICFKLNSNELVHLVVTDSSGLPHAPPQQPRFASNNGWATATWTQDGRACMLATKASERDLRKLLAATAALTTAQDTTI